MACRGVGVGEPGRGTFLACRGVGVGEPGRGTFLACRGRVGEKDTFRLRHDVLNSGAKRIQLQWDDSGPQPSRTIPKYFHGFYLVIPIL